MGNAHGLETLRCNAVLGSTYLIEVSATEVSLIETWVDTKSRKSVLEREVRHVFPLEACKFKPFSIEMECQDPKEPRTSLEISMTRLSGKAKSHEVKFEMSGVDKMKSKSFETTRIDAGKSARCIINDSFEVL